MSTASNFTKKVLSAPELAQISFDVAVLDAYFDKSDVRVTRTRTVGRVKTPTWSVDFGIAPDEKTIHVTLNQLIQKLPERERENWFSHVAADRYSENYLKMQGSHACIDDGNLRGWSEPEPSDEDSLF